MRRLLALLSFSLLCSTAAYGQSGAVKELRELRAMLERQADQQEMLVTIIRELRDQVNELREQVGEGQKPRPQLRWAMEAPAEKEEQRRRTVIRKIEEKAKDGRGEKPRVMLFGGPGKEIKPEQLQELELEFDAILEDGPHQRSLRLVAPPKRDGGKRDHGKDHGTKGRHGKGEQAKSGSRVFRLGGDGAHLELRVETDRKKADKKGKCPAKGGCDSKKSDCAKGGCDSKKSDCGKGGCDSKKSDCGKSGCPVLAKLGDCPLFGGGKGGCPLFGGKRGDGGCPLLGGHRGGEHGLHEMLLKHLHGGDEHHGLPEMLEGFMHRMHGDHDEDHFELVIPHGGDHGGEWKGMLERFMHRGGDHERPVPGRRAHRERPENDVRELQQRIREMEQRIHELRRKLGDEGERRPERRRAERRERHSDSGEGLDRIMRLALKAAEGFDEGDGENLAKQLQKLALRFGEGGDFEQGLEGALEKMFEDFDLEDMDFEFDMEGGKPRIEMRIEKEAPAPRGGWF